jgi:hypothetical protein
MKNDLFNQTLLRKYSKDFNLTPSKHDLIVKHIEKLEQGQFEAETKNYIYFYEAWLKDILGYDLEDNILFDEKEGEGRGKSEFILKSGDKKFMVVELKDQKTDLDKPQNRVNDKRTPVDQAFDYAQHTGDIDWILVSNYNEFRLYNWHKKGHYISFKANELLDKKLFSYFMLSFSKKSYIDTGYIDKLMDKTVVIERELEKEFYRLYNETRLMLIKEFEEINKLSRLNSIHYAQMIMNRYMFICFAEDIDLLPAQVSTDTILNPIVNGNLRHGSIWQRLNELFLDIDEGNEYKKISQYNGGIFKEDLDHLKIRDIVEDQKFFNDVYQNWKFKEYEQDVNSNLGPYGQKVNPIYRNLLTISTFDFSTELDVNILGHIFENSIGDIEELKEDSKGRRKKDGIFYTPDYITDYICRNTIIPYLSKSGKVNTVDELIQEYPGSKIKDLDLKVKEIKIVDPACGSGAFLNKAANVLLEIHESIREQLYAKGTLDHIWDPIEERREILLNNIYGVDLNEESVDITKLSLFLKVCRKGLILPNLEKNIKCGNSLIDDPEFTNKPFNWQTEFPKIFEDGGFDVIIGNPPYVRQEKIKEIKPYLKDYYEVYTGVADLYVYFFEKGLGVLRQNGRLGFISSNKFTKSNYGRNLRKFILNSSAFQIYFDHTYSGVFEDATTYPSVFIFKKGTNNDNKIIVNNEFELEQKRLNESEWGFVRPEVLDLKDKVDLKGTKIMDISNIQIFYGIKTGYNEAFVINEKTKNDLITKDPNSIDIIKPLLTGRDIKRWMINYKNLYLIFTRRGIDIDLYPAIKDYLSQFKEKLTPKNAGQTIGRKSGPYEWYEIQDAVDYYEEFDKNKLIYPNLASSLFVVFDENGYYTNQKCFIVTSDINLKFLGTILSSKVLNFVFSLSGTPLQGNYYDLNKKYIENLPICPATLEEQQKLIVLGDRMIQLNQSLKSEINGFKHWIQKEFSIEKLSNKLEKYYTLSEEEFIDELRKKKVDTKLRKNREYLENEFNASIQIINPLLQQIKETDNEIDKMVYDLYGLTPEEIQIIEEILNG